MLSEVPFLLLAFLGLVSTQSTCDTSNAYTPEQLMSALSQPTTPSSSSSGSDGTSCAIFPSCPYCNQDPTVELCQSWHQTQLLDAVNANNLNGASLFGSIGKRYLTILQCTDSEVCVAATTELLMCIDPSTFDFRDSNGGNGNLKSDTYTMSNAQVTSVASTATAPPTPTATGTESGSGLGTTATVGAAVATGTASRAGAAAASASASSAAYSKANGFFLRMVLFVMGATGSVL